jgi:hypothetical protein
MDEAALKAALDDARTRHVAANPRSDEQTVARSGSPF